MVEISHRHYEKYEIAVIHTQLVMNFIFFQHWTLYMHSLSSSTLTWYACILQVECMDKLDTICIPYAYMQNLILCHKCLFLKTFLRTDMCMMYGQECVLINRQGILCQFGLLPREKRYFHGYLYLATKHYYFFCALVK